MIQAIETSYQGYKFRSRLEAKWAVYFDTIGLKWEYEPEGYDLGEAGWYLPDFWLPEVRMWAEVKFDGGFDEDARRHISGLVQMSGRRCILLEGVPSLKPYMVVCVPCPDARSGACGPEEDCDWCLYPVAISKVFDRFLLACSADFAFKGHPFTDCPVAVRAARSARFEHGESPRVTDRSA